MKNNKFLKKVGTLVLMGEAQFLPHLKEGVSLR